MGQHHIVERHAAGNEALRFRVVLAIDIAHEFGHDVLVVPRRAECVFRDHPAFAKQDEIDVCGSGLSRGRGQHGEDRRIRVIEQDGADRAISGQVIFHRAIIAVPCHHIKRAVPDFGFMKLTAPFDRQGRGHFAILKRRDGGFEIAPIGHTIRPDRAAPGQFEFLAIVFAHEATRRPFEHFDPVDEAARKDRDFLRCHVDDPEFGAKPEPPFLGDHKHFAVGGIEIRILHRGGDKIDMGRHAHLGVHIPRRGHRAHPRQPCQRGI